MTDHIEPARMTEEERQRLEDQLRAAGIHAPGVRFSEPTTSCPEAYGEVRHFVRSRQADLRVWIGASAHRVAAMTDHIEPALSAETFDQFIARHYGCLDNFESEPTSVVEAVRAAYDAGRNSAPKITREMVDELRSFSDQASSEFGVELGPIADALESYLTPEGPSSAQEINAELQANPTRYGTSG